MENKPYKISKEDAIILQRYCAEIKPILEKYAWDDSDSSSFVNTRIKMAFNSFNAGVDVIIYHLLNQNAELTLDSFINKKSM